MKVNFDICNKKFAEQFDKISILQGALEPGRALLRTVQRRSKRRALPVSTPSRLPFLPVRVTMDRATFESQKAFAGEKKPSMQRRCVDNDYTARRMYMLTMVTEGRKQLFGKVVGRSEAIEPSAEAPHIELSPLGEAVEQIWQTIGSHHPEVKVVALQMMPDHLHAILFVKTQMEKPLGKVLLGVKQACNQAFREVMPVEFVAVAQQHAKQKRENGLLFAKGFNDQILLRDGQLERWLNYLKDNPRRLLIKRENPNLFRVQRGLEYGGISFSAIGNRFLLEHPIKIQVQCSRYSCSEAIYSARF